MIGRPVLWALADAGEEGVWRLLDRLRAQLVSAMAVIGASRPGAVQRTHVVRPSDR